MQWTCSAVTLHCCPVGGCQKIFQEWPSAGLGLRDAVRRFVTATGWDVWPGLYEGVEALVKKNGDDDYDGESSRMTIKVCSNQYQTL